MAISSEHKDRKRDDFPFEVAVVETGSPEHKLYHAVMSKSGVIGYDEYAPSEKGKVSIRVSSEGNALMVKRRADVVGNTEEFGVISAAYRGEDSMTIDELTRLFRDESWAKRIKAYAIAQQMIKSFSKEYLVGLNGINACDEIHERIAASVGERPLENDLYGFVSFIYMMHQYDKGME